MPIWLKSLFAVVAVLGLSFGLGMLRTIRTRRYLARTFDGRDEKQCVATCLDAFDGASEQRVRDAYLWVQVLVDYPSAPIRVDDDLWDDLRIDQGDADDLFESSYEWRGAANKPSGTAPGEPPRTVRDLIAQVLWYGYEGYAHVVRESRRKIAA